MTPTMLVMSRKVVLPVLTAFAFSCTSVEPMDQESEERLFNLDQELETVVGFEPFNPSNPFPPENPESIAADFDGNLYVSMALSGEIRKIDSEGVESTLAFLPLGVTTPECGPFGGIQGALATDFNGNLYASVASCNAEDRGVWRVSMDDGSADRIAALPFTSLPNGIARLDGRLYVADSLGAIWTLPIEGGDAEIWLSDVALAPTGFTIDGPLGPIPVPGANGIQFYGDDAYIANSSSGEILRVHVENDGNPGELEVFHVFEEEGVGCDDFAFDLFGRIYCTTDPSNQIIRISQNGSEKLLFTDDDGLDGPTAATFGRGADWNTLYITNAEFPFFFGTGNGPSVQKTERFIGGYPFR